MHLISCTNTHRDVTDLVNHGMVKIQTLEYLENGTSFFYETKKFLICYRFVAEVTFKQTCC